MHVVSLVIWKLGFKKMEQEKQKLAKYFASHLEANYWPQQQTHYKVNDRLL